MSDRFASRLAWSLFGLVVALILVPGVLLWTPGAGQGFVAQALIAALFGVVGALVGSRRPRNPIGWLFLAIAVIAAFSDAADLYAYRALVHNPGSLPGGDWMAWLGSGIWHPAFGFFVFAFLLFPNGRLPSARWRLVAWIAVVNYLVGAIIGMLWGPLLEDLSPYAEPPFELPGVPIANAVFLVFIFVNFGLLLVSAASLVVRLRRATGVERQQLKWFVYAVTLFAIIFPASVFVFGDGRLIRILLPLVPAAAGIAILRYRLFDIDLIINRALVYGSLTVTLAIMYFGGVVSLQYVSRTLTGEGSQVAIVASTLVIAALFSPLRHRVQDFIDRRFYRKKYDAAKTLTAFSAKLRNETDLNSLDAEALSVIGETMQPEHISKWLMETAERDGR